VESLSKGWHHEVIPQGVDGLVQEVYSRVINNHVCTLIGTSDTPYIWLESFIFNPGYIGEGKDTSTLILDMSSTDYLKYYHREFYHDNDSYQRAVQFELVEVELKAELNAGELLEGGNDNGTS